MKGLSALRVLAAALGLAFLACVGGGNSGSETTNGLTGVVRDVEGRPVSGARVQLLTDDFNPSQDTATAVTVTNAKGAYALEDLPPGHYHLELSDSGRGTLTLLQDVTVPADGKAVVNATLGKPGAMDVRVADFLRAGATAYVYIPGSSAWERVDSAGHAAGTVHLDQVPVGRFADLLMVLDEGGDRVVITLARDFEVQSEATAQTAPFQTWKSVRAIPLDTKALGVAGMVTDFPFLVRLTAADFDFSQARQDGGDLRFTRKDSMPLPFQIERWDALAQRAEIWVRLDTVRGNDTEQGVLMHWGRALATGILPGPKVFDASAGFATVYHLDESANEDKSGYRDATPNGNHATSAAINADAQVPGIIGSAKAFSGPAGSSTGTLAAAMPKGIGGNASFTVSFWLRYKATAVRQSILDFGKPGLLSDVHWLIMNDTNAQFGAYDSGLSGSDPAPWQNVFRFDAPLEKWAYVATVYNAEIGTIATYVNGALADSIKASPMVVDANGGLRIGRNLPSHPQDAPLNGALDEIRFLDRALGPDRVKLDYATQKP